MNQIDPGSGGWDAQTYHKVSDVQEKWAVELLSSRQWNGNEVVLDAGCGSGRVTNLIAKLLTRGKIYAVDLDQDMILNAMNNLRTSTNIEFIKSDISTVKIPEKVDIIFSNAVLHWILNHRLLFTHFKKLLKENGELLIQCGGKGNLGDTYFILESVRKQSEFVKYFKDWIDPWHFATEEDAQLILEDIGFIDINTSITKKTATFSSLEEYKLFMETVVMKPYISCLPTKKNPNIKKAFVDSFLREKKHIKESRGEKIEWSIDYVRLNISAINGSKSQKRFNVNSKTR